MNKWTILSVIALIGILSISLWMITQSQDPLLETESAAEQEIGVEEFDSGVNETPAVGDTDSETTIEPDLTINDGEEETEVPVVPAIPSDSEPADPAESSESSEQPDTAEQPGTP